MEIKLPPLTGGSSSPVLRGNRQLTVIGANGSGKSRLCNWLVESFPGKSFRISALRAIFSHEKPMKLQGSIEERFDALCERQSLLRGDANTEFEKFLHLLMADEFREMMLYKVNKLKNAKENIPTTKLDTVVRRWQQLFPGNSVLFENGMLLFSTSNNDDKYPIVRLSDGEKAVLYYLGAVLFAMPDAVIFVDDPETFIHPSMMNSLWNVIEQMRPDCTFIYNTHDINFASSRIENKCLWVKSYDVAGKTWDYEVLDNSSRLSDSLYIDLLGTRKPVLFVEGDDTHSIDARLYSLLFPEFTVKPLGSCNKVIESVRSFNDLTNLHHLDSWGIVDRDRRDDVEVKYLLNKKILVPNVAEIENILMLEGVIRAVARQRKRNEHDVFESVKEVVVNMFRKELRDQALMHVRHRVKREMETKVDMRFRSISALEEHMVDLVNEIR